MGLKQLILLRFRVSSIRTFDQIEAVHMVSAPRDNHLIRSGIADFACSDVSMIMSTHASLVIRREAFDTTRGSAHGIIFIHADFGLLGRWLAGLGLEITAKEATIVQELSGLETCG
jgi:hypothetical protein